jgi:hypothetical protein
MNEKQDERVARWIVKTTYDDVNALFVHYCGLSFFSVTHFLAFVLLGLSPSPSSSQHVHQPPDQTGVLLN